MVLAGVGLSYLMVHYDQTIKYKILPDIDWLYDRDPAGARALLSTIASAAITIVSLTFSITMVTLQLASQQYGPRLIRNFLRDRGNQFVLGTYIATFAYCILVQRSINEFEESAFVAELATTTAIGLALASLFVLIYFIHHIAYSIRAEQIILNVSEELHEAIEEIFPLIDRENEAKQHYVLDKKLPDDFTENSRQIYATSNNYLLSVDYEKLVEIACEHDLVITLNTRPGNFVINGAELMTVWPAHKIDKDLADKLRKHTIFGYQRNVKQDIEFAIDQLVEIALRALSPGVNDPFTAYSCIDRLSGAFTAIAKRHIPKSQYVDNSDTLRLVAQTSSYDGIADAAFHQIRQSAYMNAGVTLRLLDTFCNMLKHPITHECYQAIKRHAKLVYISSQQHLPSESDRQEAKTRYDNLSVLAHQTI